MHLNKHPSPPFPRLIQLLLLCALRALRIISPATSSPLFTHQPSHRRPASSVDGCSAVPKCLRDFIKSNLSFELSFEFEFHRETPVLLYDDPWSHQNRLVLHCLLVQIDWCIATGTKKDLYQALQV